MSIIKYENTLANKAIAEATPDPKYIAYGARITVFTGGDVPPAEAVADPSSIVVSHYQLRDAILAVGGQARLDQWNAMLAAPPTPRIGLYLSYAQEIARSDSKVNQARLQLAGVSAHWTNAQLNAYFVAASGLGR